MIKLEEYDTVFQFFSVIFGGVVAFFIAKMKLGKSDDEAKNLKDALIKVKAEQKDLRNALKEERKIRGKVEGKFESLKLAFRVAFNQYEIEFKDEPDHLVMLKTLREIINE